MLKLVIILLLTQDATQGQDIRDNEAFIVTADIVFNCLAYPSIPERRVEITIPLNITPILNGPTRYYHLAGTLQNTCDHFWKQTVEYKPLKRRKRADCQPENELQEDWGSTLYKPIHLDYRWMTLKSLNGLCEQLGLTIPEPYTYHVMEQLKKQMRQQGIKHTFINVKANQIGKLVFPMLNTSTADLDRATPLEAFSHTTG